MEGNFIMLIISPRSYVTAAFDLLFPHLLEYVYKKLSHKQGWWKIMVYDQKNYIFENARDVRDNLDENFMPKHYDELFRFFDEHSLCKLVLSNSVRSSFMKDDLKTFNVLQDIRIEWAHRKHLQTKSYDDERTWAEDSIIYIKNITKYYDKTSHCHTEKRISILLFKMKSDWIDDNSKLRSHTELLNWISANIIKKVIEPSSPVDENMKTRISKSFEELEKYANSVSTETASRYVIDYYWNAIRGKTDVYDEINRHKNPPSFEDEVGNFTEYCYLR